MQTGQFPVPSFGYFCVDFWETEMIENEHKEEGAGIPATMRESRKSSGKVRKKRKHKYNAKSLKSGPNKS